MQKNKKMIAQALRQRSTQKNAGKAQEKSLCYKIGSAPIGVWVATCSGCRVAYLAGVCRLYHGNECNIIGRFCRILTRFLVFKSTFLAPAVGYNWVMVTMENGSA